MRLTDYLGLRVVDRDGRDLGCVHDARLVADGTPNGPFGPALRLHGFYVGKGSLGARLGLDRDAMRGPWLLKVIFGRRRFRVVPWEDVDRVEDQTMHLK
ncbi:MAG: PRC-barrel domain containing protein [Actinomycetia bacterium]|nr:PRC-barrel domain containing protein [Actinomycetes bacterium]